MSKAIAAGSVQPVRNSEFVIAKSDTVSMSIAFQDEAARQMLKNFRQIAEELGYDKTVETSELKMEICHRADKGRTISIAVVHQYPLEVRMHVRVSGHRSDIRKCEALVSP